MTNKKTIVAPGVRQSGPARSSEPWSVQPAGLGAQRHLSESAPNNKAFKGVKILPSQGTRDCNFNQRYYDPELGRFITHDPAKQGLNPYIYCANNPLMYGVSGGGEFKIAPITNL
jgi:RHS repeat-associated protein